MKTVPKDPDAQTDKERAMVLLNLLTHMKAEAVALIAHTEYTKKKELFTELETHAHLMRRTLDTIERYAAR